MSQPVAHITIADRSGLAARLPPASLG